MSDLPRIYVTLTECAERAKMKNTVPDTDPTEKTEAANVAVLPLPNAGDPGGIRTPDTQFRSIVSGLDTYGFLTANSKNVRVPSTTLADIDTVSNTVPFHPELHPAFGGAQ